MDTYAVPSTQERRVFAGRPNVMPEGIGPATTADTCPFCGQHDHPMDDIGSVVAPSGEVLSRDLYCPVCQSSWTLTGAAAA